MRDDHERSSRNQAVSQPYKLSVTIDEAVRLTSIGKNTLYAWINDGRLKAVRIGERGRIIIPVKNLERFLLEESGTVDAI